MELFTVYICYISVCGPICLLKISTVWPRTCDFWTFVVLHRADSSACLRSVHIWLSASSSVRQSVSKLISVKLSTWCCLPLNYRLVFRSLFLSSMLETVILILALGLSSLARVFSIAVENSNHFWIQASVMSSGHSFILTCIFSFAFGCRPYLPRSIPCPQRR